MHTKGNRMKKLISKITVVTLVVLLVAFSVAFVGCNGSLKVSGSAKNVILLIGDGMGLEHLEAVAAYYQLDKLNMQSMTGFNGEVTTYSRNSEVTDSAAASTALSCGVKTDNKSVARVDNENVENMAEFIAQYNMDMGIVVTEKATGATPSGFASHSYDRSNDSNIFKGYMASGVDLFVSQYDEDILNEDRESAIINAGYTRLNSMADLTENAYSAEKIFATVDEFAGYGEDGASLVDASMFAINYLDQKSENGFFMMIESSYIDKIAHSGDFVDMARELRAFDETVKAVLDWAKQDGETLVIITADHETGGLLYNPGDNFDDTLFKTGEHSGVNVGVFIYGLNGDDLQGKTILDNIEINHIMRGYITNFRK